MTVQITGLRKSYGDNPVLHDLTMQAREGEFLTLLGPSGCGKTTTLRCVAGLERSDAGSIAIGDAVVAEPERKLFVPPNKRDIGMVFQSYALWPHMTVFGNVVYPLRMRRTERAGRRARVMEILETVGMDRLADRPVTDLSGGQQQRVALARAMVAHPRLLLFDEPLSNLDAKLRRSMRREIRQAHDTSEATSIYVTHDQEEAITLSDRVVVLREGVIQQMGTPREIYREPANPFVADFVGFDNLIAGTVVETGAGGTGMAIDGADQRVSALLGGPAAAGTRALLAVRAEDLVVQTATPAALDGVGALRGTVSIRTYTGQHVEYVVDVGAQTLLVRVADDRSGAAADLAPGSAATVVFDPARSVIVAGTPPPSFAMTDTPQPEATPAPLEHTAAR